MVLKDYEQNKLDSFLEIKKLYKNRQNAIEVYWIKNSVYLQDKFIFLKGFTEFIDEIREKEGNAHSGHYAIVKSYNSEKVNKNKKLFYPKNKIALKEIFSFYFLDENNIIKNEKYLKKRKIDKNKFIKLYGLTDVEAFDYHFNRLFATSMSSFDRWRFFKKGIPPSKEKEALSFFLEEWVPDFFDLLSKDVEKDFKKFYIFDNVAIYGFLYFNILSLIIFYIQFFNDTSLF
jgi:hypothetical protein